MTSVEAFKAMSDALLPYLTNPPVLPHAEQHAYLAASLEFAYTAVELVEAQLERSLRAVQDGLAAASTEHEILLMERRLVEEQQKVDHMKAKRRVETKRAIENAEHSRFRMSGHHIDSKSAETSPVKRRG
ncbi:hypothetical protein D9615_008602 [Tricholomella constricta]|uniref:Uncharacterized protein n=1 Tax=Tricholomella constricta TaxID=117010 RepID=A0A8H5M0M4_9AGAR|nr:hypothetical protein D9615_008602 [Tricholomella constricta]